MIKKEIKLLDLKSIGSSTDIAIVLVSQSNQVTDSNAVPAFGEVSEEQGLYAHTKAGADLSSLQIEFL